MSQPYLLKNNEMGSHAANSIRTGIIETGFEFSRHYVQDNYSFIPGAEFWDRVTLEVDDTDTARVGIDFGDYSFVSDLPAPEHIRGLRMVANSAQKSALDNAAGFPRDGRDDGLAVFRFFVRNEFSGTEFGFSINTKGPFSIEIPVDHEVFINAVDFMTDPSNGQNFQTNSVSATVFKDPGTGSEHEIREYSIKNAGHPGHSKFHVLVTSSPDRMKSELFGPMAPIDGFSLHAELFADKLLNMKKTFSDAASQAMDLNERYQSARAKFSR